MTDEHKSTLTKIIVSFAMLVVLNIIPVFLGQVAESTAWKITSAVLYLVCYLIIGFDILKEAVEGIMHGEVFDENFLMAVATIGAIALAVYSKSTDFNEAVAVMLFYQVGEFFQSYAVGKSRRNITELMDIRPDYANIERDGKLVRVSPESVKCGTTIIAQSGEKIPLDGIIVEGNSTLNTSALTGESVPREAKAGDEVTSGCINLTGVLKIKTTKEFGESTVSKILKLVEESGERKAKSENFITKFAAVYTPAVCIAAFALGVLPPMIQIILGNSPSWSVWIYRALTFLVISCPCALVISIPLSFFAGIGGASREGILIKGSNYLETLSKVRTVVFDKTGTLTKGVFEVTGIHHNEIENEKIIEYAALAECASSHPISKSLLLAHGKEIDRSRVTDIQELAGLGLTANVDGIKVAVGNSKLMNKLGLSYAECHSAGTIVHVALDNKYAGHIVISDVVKNESERAVSLLKKYGVKKTVMLTGDSDKVAQKVGAQLKIDEIHSELLPSDKVGWVEKLLEQNSAKEKLAFVGDGINDAPVLGRADIGIAMGALGSDAAIEAADVVLMDDNPVKIARGIKISRKCLGIVYQNIAFALVVKFSCLALGASGFANMWLAIFADVGVTVISVLNAMRALRTK